MRFCRGFELRQQVCDVCVYANTRKILSQVVHAHLNLFIAGRSHIFSKCSKYSPYRFEHMADA